MKIAAVQMISGPDAAPNLETAGRLIAEAAAAGAQLVALPEYFPIMGLSDADKFNVREAEGTARSRSFFDDGCAARASGSSAVRFRCSLDEAGETAQFLPGLRSARVERVARYDKIHLFGFQKGAERYNESATIEARRPTVTFDSPFGRIGVGLDLLRHPLSGTVSRPRCRRSADHSCRLHRDDRARALGNPAARARHREPVLRSGCRTGRLHENGRDDARQQHVDRSLGRDP
jgi:predicted amidohydrolase